MLSNVYITYKVLYLVDIYRMICLPYIVKLYKSLLIKPSRKNQAKYDRRFDNSRTCSRIMNGSVACLIINRLCTLVVQELDALRLGLQKGLTLLLLWTSQLSSLILNIYLVYLNFFYISVHNYGQQFADSNYPMHRICARSAAASRSVFKLQNGNNSTNDWKRASLSFECRLLLRILQIWFMKRLIRSTRFILVIMIFW